MSAVAPPSTGELTAEQLLEAYRVMRTIREFEERVHLEFATGEIPGFVHLYAGEEAIAAGVCAHLGAEDYVASTHRGHGHAIAKGCDVKGMMAEIYGKSTGICHGQGRLDAHRRPLQGHARRQRHRRRRPAAGVRRRPDRRRSRAPARSRSPSRATAAPTRARSWRASTSRRRGTCRASSSSRTTATPSRPRPPTTRPGSTSPSAPTASGCRASIVDGFDFFAVHEAAGEAIAPGPRRRRPDADRDARSCASTATSRATSRRTAAPGRSRTLRRTRDCLIAFRRRVTEAGLLDGRAARGRRRRGQRRSSTTPCRRRKAAPDPAAADVLSRRLRQLLRGGASHGAHHHLPAGHQRGAGAGDGPRPDGHRDGRGRRRRHRRRRARTTPGAACSASPRACTTRFPGRVIDTPISESAFVGAAAGAAASGLRPGRRAHVRRLHRRLLRPDLQPGGEVPLHVRRQGEDAAGDPHHVRRRPQRRRRSTRRRSTRCSRTSRG